MRNEGRGWFGTCACDTEYRVVNAAVEKLGSGCESCTEWSKDLEVTKALVNTELGWCACGNPEEVDTMMLAYLDARDTEDWPKPLAEGVSPDSDLLLSYIADDLGWTEHGTTVGGAWLSEAGKTARRNLRAAHDAIEPLVDEPLAPSGEIWCVVHRQPAIRCVEMASAGRFIPECIYAQEQEISETDNQTHMKGEV